ncbi:Retrovirus-related Pol polyprotein from transposon opus [Amphibalanus amphitrite]|uniref:Retrovirus-related Pol polyprotein from transposon opus n=1 Tax=Amphibalanus amphitrite TaxID=1232801 RepID=A0A6A4W9B3_AMPAM|nr:Retrovirus-related Pol polyprotein from transposon opus [Amphibalanus amphitrite]
MVSQLGLELSKAVIPSLTTADGSELATRGCAWVEMAVNDGPEKATMFVVAKDLTDDVLIGLDTLKELKASIQCGEMQVTVKRVPEAVLDQYPSLFARDGEDIGRVKNFQYKVRTSGPPVVSKPYKIPLHYQEEVDRQLSEMEARGTICKSSSEYASPVVVVKKGGNELRICCDYSKLNKQVSKEAYPMPALGDVLLKLRGGKIFSHLDVKSAYRLPQRASRSGDEAQDGVCSWRQTVGVERFSIWPLHERTGVPAYSG